MNKIDTTKVGIIGNVESEITYMTDITKYAGVDPKNSSELFRILGISDIYDYDDALQLEYEIAKSAYCQDNGITKELNEFEHEEEIFDLKCDIQNVFRIDRHSNLFGWLLDWYGRGEYTEDFAFKKMQEKVNGFYYNSEAIYFYNGSEGVGFSSNLFGGQRFESDARAAFYSFINMEAPENWERVRNSIIN